MHESVSHGEAAARSYSLLALSLLAAAGTEWEEPEARFIPGRDFTRLPSGSGRPGSAGH